MFDLPIRPRIAVCVALVIVTAPLSALGQAERGRIVVGGGPPAGAAAPDSARWVQRASCVLQLEFDASRGMRSDTQMLNALITSTALMDPAAQKALGLGPDAWPKVAQVELTPAGATAVRLGVTITRDESVKVPDNAAQAFLDELTARAKAAVEQIGRGQEQAAAEKLAALEKDQAAAKKRFEAVQARLAQLRRDGAPPDQDPRLALRNLTNERTTLEVTMAGQRARLKVVEHELERLTKAAETRPAAAHWAELISAREKVVQSLQARRDKGEGDDLDLFKAQADLAEARALAAAQPAQRSGFDPVDRFQSDAITLRAGLAESEVRLASLAQRIEKTGAATQPTAPPQNQDELRQEEIAAQQALFDLNTRVEQARRERQTAAGAVRLLVLDGKARQ